MRPAMGAVALPGALREAGTYTSGPIAAAGAAPGVLLCVHVSAVVATGTLDVSLEKSATGAGSWSAVTGSGITQLTAAGNAVAFANVDAPFVRVSAVVGTEDVTFEVAVLAVG